MGKLQINGDLLLAAGDEDRFLTFNYTGGTGYDWRIGYLGSGSGNENFLVFQSDKEGSTFYNALKFGLTTLNAEFGGTVTASSFIGNLSGNATSASSAPWSGITGKPSTFTPSSHTHNTLDSINASDEASSSATQRYVFMAYNDLTTNRPAYDTRLTFQTSTGTLSAPTFKGNLSGTASYATQASTVYGPYSGNGGNQVPSYIGTNTTRFAMMRNFGSSDIGGYMDCILMNNYSWSDVPYATGLGITKVNGYPRAIIANGPKDKWAYATELLTSYNYSWWALPVSGGTMTGKLQVNNIIFGYNYTNSNNAAAFMWDKNGSNYTGVGSCNTTDMIHFGPCNASGAWVSNYNQIWRFQGGVYATGWLETDNYGTGDPGTSTPGYGRGGAIYFKVVG